MLATLTLAAPGDTSASMRVGRREDGASGTPGDTSASMRVGTDEKIIEGRALLINGLYGAVDVVTQEERDIIAAGEFAKRRLPGHHAHLRLQFPLPLLL